jgi:hypothetical protein
VAGVSFETAIGTAELRIQECGDLIGVEWLSEVVALAEFAP